LVLIPHLTSISDQGQTIDVAAHIGTLGAVMLYLRRDIWAMLKYCCATVFRQTNHTSKNTGTGHLILLLIVASLPVMLAGLVAEWLGADALRLIEVVAFANIIFAFWLWFADKKPVQLDLTRNVSGTDHNQGFDWQKMTIAQSFYIGLAQIFALIPGASRSGVTMSMARQLGFDRLSAARFSLLLSLPVIAGAGLIKGVSVMQDSTSISWQSIMMVAGLSFCFALLAIRWMMAWLAKTDFRIFVWYRLALGLILLVLVASGHSS